MFPLPVIPHLLSSPFLLFPPLLNSPLLSIIQLSLRLHTRVHTLMHACRVANKHIWISHQVQSICVCQLKCLFRHAHAHSLPALQLRAGVAEIGEGGQRPTKLLPGQNYEFVFFLLFPSSPGVKCAPPGAELPQPSPTEYIRDKIDLLQSGREKADEPSKQRSDHTCLEDMVSFFPCSSTSRASHHRVLLQLSWLMCYIIHSLYGGTVVACASSEGCDL